MCAHAHCGWATAPATFTHDVPNAAAWISTYGTSVISMMYPGACVHACARVRACAHAHPSCGGACSSLHCSPASTHCGLRVRLFYFTRSFHIATPWDICNDAISAHCCAGVGGGGGWLARHSTIKEMGLPHRPDVRALVQSSVRWRSRR